MLVLLAGIFVVHIATVIMLFVSTISNVWMVTTIFDKTNSSGLWKQCFENTCHDLVVDDNDLAALKAVQAFMILAIIFSFISLVMFVVQLFTMEKGKRFYITGAIMLICWLFILIAASIYTARFLRNTKQVTMDIPLYLSGSAFALASLLGSCILYSGRNEGCKDKIERED